MYIMTVARTINSSSIQYYSNMCNIHEIAWVWSEATYNGSPNLQITQYKLTKIADRCQWLAYSTS